MIYLDPEAIHIKEAKERHYRALICRITKKTGGDKCLNKNCKICNSRALSFSSSKGIQKKIISFLNDENLKTILTEVPKELEQINNLFFEGILGVNWENRLNNYFDSKKRKTEHKVVFNLFNDIHSIFDYKWLCDLEPVEESDKENNYSLYDLANKLDIRTCTYCNRSYTNTLTTMDNKKLMRPQFDHWFPKWRYPLLACSFYNLIPSCYTCNSSSKGKTLLNLDDHIHPYIDEKTLENFQFDYLHRKVSGYHIYVKRTNTDSKALNTLKTINIDRMYNAHHEELDDLIKLRNAYGKDYIKRMIKLFPKAELNSIEIYKFIFGIESVSSDFHKRPMSKFKNDILKELGIIPQEGTGGNK